MQGTAGGAHRAARLPVLCVVGRAPASGSGVTATLHPPSPPLSALGRQDAVPPPSGGSDPHPGLRRCFPPPPTSRSASMVSSPRHQCSHLGGSPSALPTVTGQMGTHCSGSGCTAPNAPRLPWSRAPFGLSSDRRLPLPVRGALPAPARPREGRCCGLCTSLCFFFAGDAPFCTPEQHKECAEPALGQYWGHVGCGEVLREGSPACRREAGWEGGWERRGERLDGVEWLQEKEVGSRWEGIDASG